MQRNTFRSARILTAAASLLAAASIAPAQTPNTKVTNPPSTDFGIHLAAAGDTLLVTEDSVILKGGTFAGLVHVRARNTGGADNWGEVISFTGSDTVGLDLFGVSLDISGDVCVVGAPGHTGGGAAYIFERNQGGPDNWGEVKKITGSDSSGTDTFGTDVAIEGDIIVVTDHAVDDIGTNSGAAYVFARNQGGPDNWGEIKKITASDAASGDEFGWSVTMSGDTFVVGAHFDDDLGDNAGSAYVFARNQGGTDNWGEVTKLTASDGAAGDVFGTVMDASGDTLIIGAPGDNGIGSAYIFSRNSGGADNWGEVAKLTGSDSVSGDDFGHAVALNHTLAIVGAGGHEAAYFFSRNDGGPDAWNETGQTTGDDTFIGYAVAVAIAVDTAFVGAPSEPLGGGSTGAVYTYSISLVPSPCPGDLDYDGDTDVFDFGVFAPGFGCGTE